MSGQSQVERYPLLECAPHDIPQMYEVYDAAFSAQPTNDVLFPSAAVDPDEKREWFIKSYEEKFRRGDVRFFKIVDSNVSRSEGTAEREGEGVEEASRRGKVVAWMKWGFPLAGAERKEGKEGKEEGIRDEGEKAEREGGEEGEGDSGWPKGTNLSFMERHYGMLDGWQEKYVVPEETYVAHFLCTHPNYQRKGFASRLLRVGLDKADEEGRRTYIEASPDGYPLYLRLGFKEVERETFSLKDWGGKEEDLSGHVCMLRESAQRNGGKQ